MRMRSSCIAICLASCLTAGLLGAGCASAPSGGGSANGGSGGSGGTSGATGPGGSSASGAVGGSSKGGSSSGAGGLPSSGGSSERDTSISTGGASATSGGTRGQGGGASGGASAASGGRSGSSGGTAGTGGSAGARTGGASGVVGTAGANGGGSGGITSSSGGAIGSGGTNTSIGGATSTSAGGATAIGGTTASYTLPPPDQCHDRDYIPGDSYAKTGCLDGVATSECGGKCQTASACENTSSKPNADVEFMCPRNLLFSPEMEQAVIDDGLQGFHYGVVGHDPDQGGIDGTAHSCCQCYQLVYAYPSPSNDRQVQVNPDNPVPPASAIPLPPPLIVQSFNTAATPTTFDVYMPAGGMGANNACYPVAGATGGSGKYMYSNYPPDGQPGNGGVKPASLYQECKTTDKNWVTQATLTSSACVTRTKTACDKIVSPIPGLTAEGSTNCLKANTIDTFYHLNWSVYAMKVECPEHLTRVTGCKLATQTGVKAVKKDVKTAAQAAQDPDFWSKTSHTNNLYETTTMEDCCRPTCASYSQISSFGLVTDPQYRSFYNCDVKGVPYTQPQ